MIHCTRCGQRAQSGLSTEERWREGRREVRKVVWACCYGCGTQEEKHGTWRRASRD